MIDFAKFCRDVRLYRPKSHFGPESDDRLCKMLLDTGCGYVPLSGTGCTL